MREQLLHVLLNLAPAIVVAVLTAVLTVRLSLRRFYAERWEHLPESLSDTGFEAIYVDLKS